MRIHRLLAGSFTVTATVAAGALVAAPANAALTNPQLYAASVINHASTCSSSTSGGTSNTTFSDDGNAVTQNQSSAGTVSTGSDVTQVAAAGNGTIKVTRSGGSFATADFKANASATAVPSSPSTTCSVSTEGYTYATFGVTVAHPGWITVSTTGTSSGDAFEYISVAGTGTGSIQQTVGSRMVGTTQLLLLQAGSYNLGVEYGATAAAASTSVPQHSRVAMASHLVYTPAGGAYSAASGTGTAYVRLAGARNCAANNVAATFTANAGKVKTATFYVNGVKKKTVSSPSGGTSALLGGLSGSSGATVRAVLALKAGGSATATRTYVPCN